MAQKIFIAALVVITAAICAYLTPRPPRTETIAQKDTKKCLSKANVCSPGKICGPQVVSVC